MFSHVLTAFLTIVGTFVLYLAMHAIKTRKPPVKKPCHYSLESTSDGKYADKRVITTCQLEDGHEGVHCGITQTGGDDFSVWWEKRKS